jgi:hypothetical protein
MKGLGSGIKEFKMPAKEEPSADKKDETENEKIKKSRSGTFFFLLISSSIEFVFCLHLLLRLLLLHVGVTSPSFIAYKASFELRDVNKPLSLLNINKTSKISDVIDDSR